MAVTKIWPVRGNLARPLRYVENPEKTGTEIEMDDSDLQSLSDVMQYAANEEKTEHRYFVTGVRCYPETARTQFMTVKKQFAKEGGIICFHAYQSFAPGEADPKTAHRAGVELAERLWGDRFQVIVATHLNTRCLHNHFVINSVSWRDGKRYHDCKESYRVLQKTSDDICREMGLSVIEKRSPEYYGSRTGKAASYEKLVFLKQAVDESVMESRNMQEFVLAMRRRGYVMQTAPHRKYWTALPKGSRRPIRMARLGEGYTNQEIIARVESTEGKIIPVFIRQRRRYHLPTRGEKILKETSGLYRQYLYYCYKLGAFPKYTRSPWKVPARMRSDLKQLRILQKEVHLLAENQIGTMDELILYKEKLQSGMELLVIERKVIAQKIRRKNPIDVRMVLTDRRKELTEQIAAFREQIWLAEDIEKRTEARMERLIITEKEEVEKSDILR